MKHRWVWGPLLAALLVAAVVWVAAPELRYRLAEPRAAPGQPAPRLKVPPPDTARWTRLSEQGGVTVAATFLNPSAPATYSGQLIFALNLDTHSVDLSGYRVEQGATLVNDRNETLSSGFTWKANLESEHHRSGQLQVGNRTAAGRPFWASGTKLVRLELKNPGGLPVRRFEWRFP